MKREMRFDLINIFLILFLFLLTSCSLLPKHKKKMDIEELTTSIILDDPYLLNKCLTEINNIEAIYNNKETILEMILQNNSIRCLNVVLVRDVNLEKKDSLGQTAIFKVRSLEILKKLIKNHVNINAVDNNGETVLTYFIKYKPLVYAKYLTRQRPNFETLAKDNTNTLYWAVINGDIELIQLMTKYGANFSKPDFYGNYPIYYSNDEQKILTLLNIKRYDLKQENNLKENVLGEVYLKCVSNGYYKAIDKLLKLGVNPYYMSYGNSALTIARATKNSKMIKFLNDKGIK